MGYILSKVKERNGGAVFASKDACRECTNRCTDSRGHKTVYFGPGTKHVGVRMYGRALNAPPEGMVFHNSFSRKRVQTKVLLRIKEDKSKLKTRMCTVEHPFGSIKWYGGAHYLLCRGKEKTAAEIGLSFLAYNMKRAIRILGVPGLIQAIRNNPGGVKSLHFFQTRGDSKPSVSF